MPELSRSQPPELQGDSGELSQVADVQDIQWILVLSGFSVLLVIWAFLGRIPETVTGRAFLIGPGNIRRITSEASGTVDKIFVSNGSQVQAGKTISTLSVPDLKLSAEQQKSLLVDLTKTYSLINSGYNSLLAVKEKDLTSQYRALQAQLVLSRQQTIALTKFNEGLKALSRSGAISTQTLLSSEQAFAAQLEKERALEQQLLRTNEEKKELSLANQKDLLLQRIDFLQRRADAQFQIQKLSRVSQIRSPVNGRVYGLTVQRGDAVTEGQLLATIVLNPNEGMEMMVAASSQGKMIRTPTFVPSTALLYFGSAAADLLTPGNQISLTPDGYNRDEYGGIRGQLKSIANLASSRESLIAATGSESLADQLLQQGLTYVGVASLELDPNSPSGYQWTGGRGPDRPVFFGSSAAVQAVTRYRAPIGYVLPFLREWSGLFRL
jgi:HlyD family secretion protein